MDVTTGTGLQSCPGSTSGMGVYCCLGFDSECDCDADVVSISSGTIVTTLPLEGATSTSASTSTKTGAGTVTGSASGKTGEATAKSSGQSGPTDIPLAAEGDKDGSDGGMSSGAKIGVGVGAGAGGLVLIALLALFIMRKRKQGRDMALAAEKRIEMSRNQYSAPPDQHSRGRYSPQDSFQPYRDVQTPVSALDAQSMNKPSQQGYVAELFDNDTGHGRNKGASELPAY
jgi:hypothetical protein